MLTQAEYEDSYEASSLRAGPPQWKRIRVAAELFTKREAKRPYYRVHYNPIHAARRFVRLVDYHKQKKEI